MEKQSRFMAELRDLLTRHEVVLIAGREDEDQEEATPEEVFAVFMNDRLDDPEGYQGHPVYGEDGAWADYAPPQWPEIPIDDEGASYLHCGLCIQEWNAFHKDHLSPRAFARQQSAWTAEGLQIWCTRHEANIAHIDFSGHKMRANMRRLLVDAEKPGLGKKG
jgi:hypothetical protein